MVYVSVIIVLFLNVCQQNVSGTFSARDYEKERTGGSAASVMVVNGEKLAIASIGDHRVVVCKDGEAHQIRDRKASTKHWSQFIFPG